MAGVTVRQGRGTSALFELDLAAEVREIAAALESPEFIAVLGKALRDTWASYAENELTDSRDVYLAALGEPEIDGHFVTVTLNGEGEDGGLALAVEEGSAPRDMKIGVLFQDGRYIQRFTHKGPFARQGASLGRAFDRFGGAGMGKELVTKDVRTAIGALRKTRGGGGRFSKRAGRLKAGLVPKLTDAHAGDIFAKMRYRSVQTKKGTPSESGYETFRTMTPESEGWIHPGIEAHHFGERALGAVDKILDAAIDEVLRDVMG